VFSIAPKTVLAILSAVRILASPLPAVAFTRREKRHSTRSAAIRTSTRVTATKGSLEPAVGGLLPPSLPLLLVDADGAAIEAGPAIADAIAATFDSSRGWLQAWATVVRWAVAAMAAAAAAAADDAVIDTVIDAPLEKGCDVAAAAMGA